MVEAFVIPLKFKIDSATRRQLDNIQVGGGGKKGGPGGGIAKTAGLGAIFGGGGGAAGSLGTALGIGALVGVAVQILSQFKSVTSIAGVIIKVLIEFLRPIADVVLLLLMPVLQILRPILQVVRQIMAPFRQLAFSLSRQGSEALREGDTGQAAGLFALSFQAILTGVQAVFGFFTQGILSQIIDASGFLLKGIFNIMATLIGPILQFFGVNVEQLVLGFEEKIDGATKLMKDGLALGLATIFSLEALGIAKLAEQLGADVSLEYKKVNDTLGELFIGEENSFKATFEDMTDAFENSVTNFDNVLLGPNGLVSKFEEAANRIGNIQVSAGGGGGRGGGDQGLFSAAVRFITRATSVLTIIR